MRYLLREQDRPPLLHSAALQKALLLAEERAREQQQQSKGYLYAGGRSQQQQQSAAAVATATATPSSSGRKSILLSKCRRPISKARDNNQETTSSLNKNSNNNNNKNGADDREDDDDDDDDVFDISQDDDDDDWEDDDDDDCDDEVQEAVLECDFYRNPTILSRLILHQKYTSAIRRVQEHPNEARVWLCTIKESSTVPKREQQEQQRERKDQQQKERQTDIPNDDDDDDDDDDVDDDVGERDYFYAMRQLPIHMCCQNLFRAADPHLRGELEELIGYLAYAYPAGCTYEDHCGNLPLHTAVWHHCKPEAISILLMAAPRVSHRRDHCYGKTAIELNQNRTTTTTGILRGGSGGGGTGTGTGSGGDDNDNREQVQYLLTRGSVFWEMARQEAHLRLKHRVVQRIHNADDYTALASVGSTSVLASSQAAHDNSTILTHDDITDLGGVALLGGGGSIAGGGGLDGENNGGLDSENADLTSIPLDATETERESSEDHDEGGPSGVVHPLAWSQLEQRALNLEEALAEVFQQNYQMAETISELEQQHVILQQQLQEQQKRQQQRLEGTETSQVKDVQRNNDNHLQEENAALRLQLRELTLQNSQYKRRLDLMEDHLGALSDNASSTTGDGHGASAGNKQRAPNAAQDEATADNNNNETTTSNSLTLSSMDHAVCGSSASRSTATATTIDDDDVVDHHRGYVDADAIMNSILYDAEKLNGGQQLSSELLSAWKAVSVSCRSMSTTLRTDDVGVIMPVMYDTINENADAAPPNNKATAEEMMEAEVVEPAEGAASPTSTTSPTTPAYSPAATTTKGGASSSPASAVTPTAATSSSRLVGEMLIEEADANSAALEQGRMLRQQYEDPAGTTPPRQNTNLSQPTTDRSVSRSASSSSQPVARSVSRNASSSSQPGHRGVSRNVSSSSAARQSPYPVDPLSSREESSFEGTGGVAGAVASGGIILFRNNDDQGSLALSSVTSGERVVLDSDDLDAMFAQAAQMSDNLDVMFAHAAGAGHNGNSSSSSADDDAATPSENPSGIWV